MKRIVVTGGHGVGKTSLLLALEERGEHVVLEAGQAVRRLDQARDRPFPEDDPAFEGRVLTRHLGREERVPRTAERVFFDRGGPDHLAYASVGRWPLTANQVVACRACRYDHVVLLEGPPRGLLTLDRVEARFSVRLVAELESVYEELGMPVQRLSWSDVDSRADAMLELVSATVTDFSGSMRQMTDESEETHRVPDYLPTAPYRGTRDFLPPEMSIRTQVFHRLYEVIERYGFVRYDGPILESAEIYEAKSGEEIANQQLYSLTDRSGRRLALRPEMTPSVARMIANNVGKLRFPVRWYCHVNCHRYERPQRGRVREHWQINVDTFGSESPNVEIEFFELIHDMMAALGAEPGMWRLRVNDRILLESILADIVEVPIERLRDVSSLVDRWEKQPRDKLAAEAADLGLTDPQFERLSEAIVGGATVLDDVSKQARERSPLMKVLASSAADLVVFDPVIVRAFEYYTSTVFEVFDTDPVNSRSLFGGGRYSDLVSLFSPKQIPAFGFGMGDVTLHDFLDVHGLMPESRNETDVVVIPIDETLADPARRVARGLRAAGLRTTTPLELRKVGKELSRADEAGAKAAVIIGPDEWSAQEVTVRDMASKDQQRVSFDAAPEAVSAIVAGPGLGT